MNRRKRIPRDGSAPLRRSTAVTPESFKAGVVPHVEVGDEVAAYMAPEQAPRQWQCPPEIEALCDARTLAETAKEMAMEELRRLWPATGLSTKQWAEVLEALADEVRHPKETP